MVAKVNDELDPFISRQKSGHSDPHMDFVFGSANRRIPAFTISKPYRDVMMENDLIHALTERVFVQDPSYGYWLSVSQIIQVGPGEKAQEPHRDQWAWSFWDYLSPLSLESWVNYMIALSTFTKANGATRTIPGTHIVHNFDFEAKHATIRVEMNPGDAFSSLAEFFIAAAQILLIMSNAEA
ncbi:hypothetical protein PENCOP_c005G08694 [Penicillium coprophilum]|uniref:Uncharacterized protein n=1 Tax=Penicillium coprophilum TaxID=36646 RepID=A0A1V6USD2_9EURO|nr:hypothetical protein PENCOP_c005G08694 [Penicillium coprophilum]